jgi:hypothetical protein
MRPLGVDFNDEGKALNTAWRHLRAEAVLLRRSKAWDIGAAKTMDPAPGALIWPLNMKCFATESGGSSSFVM